MALYLVAGLVVSGFDFRREARKLRFGRIAIDITERSRGGPHQSGNTCCAAPASVVSKVGSFDRRRLVLIDLQPEEGIVGRSNLERAVRYLIPAIRDLAEVRKGGR